MQKLKILLLGALMVLVSTESFGQWQRNPTPNDSLNSPRVLSGEKIVFSIYAPEAETVGLGGTDIPGLEFNTPLTRRDNGVWTLTVGPVPPGAYRYHFIVDGVAVVDPKNPATSESNANTWSLVHLPGSDFMDTKDVPHGAVAEVTYYSQSLERFRRMHVYTPPGYESGRGQYPVFYLLHGAMDCDDSWSTVGRAGFILDNLIAGGKAVPMIVVMPAGHTGPFRFGGPPLRMDEFVTDFTRDIMPLVESRYRVSAKREHRAIADLSMGGAHTLDIAIPHLDQFAWFGVFSSGVFGITGGGSFGGMEGESWEERNKATLDDPALKKGLELVWFATGREDFLVETSRATVKALENHGFTVNYHESEGGHTWTNWREYLYEFAPLLFQ